MQLIERLKEIWKGVDYSFLICGGNELKFSEIESQEYTDLSNVKPGDVVAIIGDFDPQTISTLLRLIDLKTIVVPLTTETTHEHEYFFETALIDVIIEDGVAIRREHADKHILIQHLRDTARAGLVLFSTGTTGRPKAILHDFNMFLKRFETPRLTLRTINFLLFDHIGGINTLLHTLFNKGVVIAPSARTVDAVIAICRRYDVEVLPTTPTFLRMMLMSGAVPDYFPPCLKVVTYGTERMDQPTLDELCRLLPDVDFRQTFGMSELGIVRVKSEARNSLFMKVGGEGVETRVINGILQIRSASRMLGYLNADSPFDNEGWYDTKDVVEQKNDLYKVVGRVSDVINVGGLKFMASEVERMALLYPGISLVSAYPRQNPITGQHVEMTIQPVAGVELSKDKLMSFFKDNLQPHMVPKRIKIEVVTVGHRFKRI
jgi:acyl-CoA synthetase (AMP-forming)/AMP-acid ligase II